MSDSTIPPHGDTDNLKNLHVAAYIGHLRLCKQIVSSLGQSVSNAKASSSGFTPLNVALMTGHEHIAITY
jgi:ankyrin repeat protein